MMTKTSHIQCGRVVTSSQTTPHEIRSTKQNQYCFFFQAEDGIRYTSVTGVQTCALPILARGELVLELPRLPGAPREHPLPPSAGRPARAGAHAQRLGPRAPARADRRARDLPARDRKSVA